MGKRKRAKRQVATDGQREASGIVHQEAPVVCAETALKTRGLPYYWPEGEPLPKVHRKVSQRHPCPKCRRLFLDDGSQAAVCVSSGELAYFRCRACAHRWSLATQGV